VTLRRVMDWFRRHERAVGVGVTVSAFALLAIAVVIGVAIFTRMPPPTGGVSPSSEPSTSAVPSPSIGATPISVPTATAVPTPGFEAPPGILPPNSLAVVVVDALHVRSEPRLDAEVVATLPADTVVELSLGWIGPTVADGIDWYPVVYQGDLAGYAAAGADGERYLELAPPRCEGGDPDLAALVRLTAWERLACFGDRSLTVIGTFGCPVCGIAYPVGGYEPHWLASPDNLNYLGIGGEGGLRPTELILHFPPEAGLDRPPNASILRVIGTSAIRHPAPA